MNFRRSRGALVALGLSSLAVAVAPSIASAASVGESFDTALTSGSENLGTYHLNGDPLNLAKIDVDVTSKATWKGELMNIVTWDSAKVRQGADLNVNRSSPMQSGTLQVRWTVSGSVKPAGLDAVSFTSKSFGVDATCIPHLLGGGYDCTASAGIPLVKTMGVPLSPYVKLALKAKFTITPEGAIVNRTFSLGGDTAGSASNLPLGVLPSVDTMDVPCAPVGSDATYRLSSFRWSPAVAVTQQPAVQIGLMDPVLGLAESPAIYDGSFGPSIKTNPTFVLTGTSHVTNLGGLLANNVAPTIAPLPAFSGKAGVPVQFSANASGRCDIETYTWKFSNGTTSYGAAPQRTFSTAGVYDGELTVTDASGLKAKRSFTVNVTK